MEHVDAVRVCPEDPRATERLAARATTYVLSDYLTAREVPGAARFLRQVPSTSKTFAAFEGAGARKADPAYDHAHASQWFSELNRQWGLVEQAVRADIQTDYHQQTSNYLYVDGHVEAIPDATIQQWIDEGFDFAQPR
nr:H-X9-DG-CTERM domain-containing protein [Posidoniimonas corsicana]